MTLSVGLLALLNSNLLQYAEPLGKLTAMIDAGKASVCITPSASPGGVHVRVCFIGRDAPPCIDAYGAGTIDVLKTTIDAAWARNVL